MSVSAILRRPGIRIVVVIGEPFLAVFGNDSHVPRTGEFAGAGKEEASAAGYHIDAISIEIRTGYGCRASNANVVSAINAGTTGAPIHEQVVVAAVVIDV